MSLWIEAGAEALLLIGPYAVIVTGQLVLYAVLRRRRKKQVDSKNYHRDGITWEPIRK